MKGQTLPVVIVAVGDLLTLFEHVIFGLVVGNRGRHRGLLAILGVVVGVLVVGVLVLGFAPGAGAHGCESYLPVPGTQSSWPLDCRNCGLWSKLALWPSSWRSLIAMTLDHRSSPCPAPCGLIVFIR